MTVRHRIELRPRLGPKNPVADAGDLMWYPADAIPANWVVADGTPMLPADQPALFRAIGYRHGKDSFNRFLLPQYTDFLRPQDTSTDGTDAGRVEFTKQLDEIRSHGHGGGATTSGGGHTHPLAVRGSPAPYQGMVLPISGPPSQAALYGIQSATLSSSGGHSHGVSTTSVGNVETAPNHAVHKLCICLGADLGLTYIPT